VNQIVAAVALLGSGHQGKRHDIRREIVKVAQEAEGRRKYMRQKRRAREAKRMSHERTSERHVGMSERKMRDSDSEGSGNADITTVITEHQKKS
jgi:hypothetical protein